VSTRALSEHLDSLGLVDHHVHGAFRDDVTDERFEEAITESDRGRRHGHSAFDSQIGFALLRWCAPLLGLEPHASPNEYLARRRALGAEEVNRRYLRGEGSTAFLVDTGYRADDLLSPGEMAAIAGGNAHEVVRLEAVAEEVAQDGGDASGFPSRLAERLSARLDVAVGTKSIVAYRHGFDLDPERPDAAAVVSAAGEWLSQLEAGGRPRLTHPTLLRHLLWSGIDAGLPLQLHAGYGDTDLDLHRANPLLLTEFLRLAEPSGTPVVLLHCYPFHREAGYLAHMFPHVFFDVGLALNYAGGHASTIVAESLEVAPFSKQLFSSDAWGASELHYLGARLWRNAMARVLGGLVESGEWSLGEARRVASMIGADNALALYRLEGRQAPSTTRTTFPSFLPSENRS
jgi:predicted TIM-barrel fold metal-dependent hydrolase